MFTYSYNFIVVIFFIDLHNFLLSLSCLRIMLHMYPLVKETLLLFSPGWKSFRTSLSVFVFFAVRKLSFFVNILKNSQI